MPFATTVVLDTSYFVMHTYPQSRKLKADRARMRVRSFEKDWYRVSQDFSVYEQIKIIRKGLDARVLMDIANDMQVDLAEVCLT
jgi:hypothetical protein